MRELAYKDIYSTFGKDCVGDKNYDYTSVFFENIAQKAYNNLIQNHTPQENPFIIRLAGQTGSGKTTQLLPAIKEALDDYNIERIHIAVRIFAKYHPKYDELFEKYGQNLIREQTNGFALLLLYRVVEKLVENNYNLLFEMTLLEDNFEKYLLHLAKNHNYSINYNLLAVAKSISEKWLIKRANSSIIEKNRIVPVETLNYFDNVLQQALNFLVKNQNMFDSNDKLIMWSANDSNPIFLTNYFDFNIIKIFDQQRKIENFKEIEEEKLLYKKKLFYKMFYLNYFNNNK